MLGHGDRDRRQLGDLTAKARPRRHDPPQRTRAHTSRSAPAECSTISSTRSGDDRRYLPSCPCCPPGLRPGPFPRGRGGADGSCDGGNDELRELRLSRRSGFRPPEPSETLVRLDQPADHLNRLVEPKQQPDRRLTITIQNRLGLNPLHTRFAARNRYLPSWNAYRIYVFCRYFEGPYRIRTRHRASR